MVKHTKNFNSDLRNFRESEINILDEYIEQIKIASEKPDLLLYNWPRFVRTNEITRFITFYEMYKKIQDIQGSIFQVGVLEGNTLFSYAHLVENFEFRNYTRKLYAFDTFGSQDYNKIVKEDGTYLNPKGGGWKVSSFKEFKNSVNLFNKSKIFNQFKGIEIKKGDASKEVPKFLSQNKGTMVAMLNLQVSSYFVEKKVLREVWPRIPKGGLIHFASLGFEGSPGVGQMLDEAVGMTNVKIQRFPFATKPTFIIKE